MQNETLGNPGRRNDSVWRDRRRLTIARERLSDVQHDRMLGLLRACDPRQEAWNVKEAVRQIYDHTDPVLAVKWIADIGRDFIDREVLIEVQRLGRTISSWTALIIASRRSHVSNGRTEAVNNPAKRMKLVAFGLVNFRHHRARCPLYAGKLDRTLLPTIQP